MAAGKRTPTTKQTGSDGSFCPTFTDVLAVMGVSDGILLGGPTMLMMPDERRKGNRRKPKIPAWGRLLILVAIVLVSVLISTAIVKVVMPNEKTRIQAAS